MKIYVVAIEEKNVYSLSSQLIVPLRWIDDISFCKIEKPS